MMDRREFLKATLLASSAPFWARLNAVAAAEGPVPIPNHLLLVIFLAGGNDGLNTVVPYLDPTYKRLRPTIALTAEDLFALGGGMGLHRSMPTVKKLWNAGHVSIVQNVGYAKPNFSHFESTEIWETGSPDRRFYAGWLGRYLDATDAPAKGPVRAVAIGTSTVPRTITGASGTGVTMNSLGEFNFADAGYAAEDVALRRTAFEGFRAGVAADGSMKGTFVAAQDRMVNAVRTISEASSRFSIEEPTPAQIVAQMFDVGVGTEIGFLSIGAFDTHVGQPDLHAASLQLVDDAIASFFGAAKALGLADRATVLTFSDFGRRVGENAGSGTDHGSSMPMFVIGKRVRGGLVGNRPDLDRLVDGNLEPSVAMQSVYATILERGFRVSASSILGGSYPLLPIYL